MAGVTGRGAKSKEGQHQFRRQTNGQRQWTSLCPTLSGRARDLLTCNARDTYVEPAPA